MIIRALYTVLLALVAPFLLYSLFRKKEGKPHVGCRWKEHFGYSPKLSSNGQPIWIHAVSVGETIAATPLIKQIKQNHPELTILLTTTTPTGAKQAEALGDLVEHRYMPIDFSFAVNSFIKRFTPSQLLIIETELWPNTLHQVHKTGIPATLVNARLSDKSFKGYRRISPLFKQCIPALTQVLCQYDSDVNNFAKLGIQKEKLEITGSIKFDIKVSKESQKDATTLRSNIGEQRPVWIAASTHQGEDEIVLSAHKLLLQDIPNALLILVPRHPERFSHVEQLSASMFKTVARTDVENIKPSVQVYIGNTMGEMMTLIGASDVCFMGGSLLGKKVGGHNLLEPAALKKPMLTGPSNYNFKEISSSLINAKACVVVENDRDISCSLRELLMDSHKRQTIGKNAGEIVESSKGALSRTITYVGLN
ncbi:3-deoxy-D-manno-octulosonic acid transferase [Vibrio aquaticus]|uniref:3-deoxy-D-manno-octulosonic acid transferase n=1 Tax=Vibrio aquaticus TaxID=2496559 RepID=A0A432CTM7_9VIBR|nr:lipid IV(A) 3-deoxy-D-manno-octulosonic acid transferase [Vibrio aquaticus]RTZ14642.1 3-deoxy-D-manno-octulosonic acid transferase [Vibrio aquaticus]